MEKLLTHLGATMMILMSIFGAEKFNSKTLILLDRWISSFAYIFFPTYHSGRLIASLWVGLCVMMEISLNQRVTLWLRYS